MDFLDPQKQKAHARRLIAGYILIGMVVVLAATILLYQAFGYGVDKHGKIFQNGLVFMSSTPEAADIYIDGKRESDRTDVRLALPAGQHVFELSREGYRPWKRAITVEGGTVQRFDYPFLFPNQLDAVVTKQYPAVPGLLSQSPDRRWLFAQNTSDSFDLFDLESAAPVPATFTVPVEIMSAGTSTTGWQEVAWAKDNKHVVLRRLFTGSSQQSTEYILLDRENASRSVNLSVLLGFTPTQLQLRDDAHDQYYAFDQANGLLFTASLDRPTPQPYLDKVLAFQSEGSNAVVYATSQDAPPGKTLIRMRDGADNYTIRQVASDAAPYLLEIERFEDNWFVAVGASGEDKVYTYKNPLDSLKSSDGDVLVPVYILKADNPNYISFAPEGSRFVFIENGPEIAVYDVKNNKGYAYLLETPVDAPGHATWMNEFYLQITSAGTTFVFDYDAANREALLPVAPGTTAYFDPDFRRMYTLSTANALTATNLRTQQDQ